MPRNGDGSGDNGPIDGHEILHGTSGDTTLQHTKHVAPMPKPEDGDALPGMNASGGAAAPLNDASEEYGANAPRNEQYGDDVTSALKNGASGSGNSTGATGSSNKTSNTGSATSSSPNTQQTSTQSSSGTKSSPTHDTHGSQRDQGQSGINNITREKAERYVNLDEEDVQHAGTSDSKDDVKRSSQRAPRDVGPKEDIEQLHGKATLGSGDDKSEGNSKDDNSKQGSGASGSGQGGSRSGGGGKQGSGGDGEGGGEKKGNGNSGNVQKGSGNGGAAQGDHEHDPMRHKAAKFLNIDE